MYKRLFTFGCSYTSHLWPTWADIIAYDQQIESHNQALPGAGNVYIASSMLASDLKYKFTSTDLILVNWSSWQREDRVDSNGKWRLHGSIFNNKYFDKKFIKKYWNEYNDCKRNTDAIIGANKMFNINYQSQLTDYEDESVSSATLVLAKYHEFKDIYWKNNTDFFDNYEHILEAMPKKNFFDDSASTGNIHFNGNLTSDAHPDVLCHLSHAKTVYEELGMKLDERTINKYENIQRCIIQDLENTSLGEHVNECWENTRNFFSNDKYM